MADRREAKAKGRAWRYVARCVAAAVQGAFEAKNAAKNALTGAFRALATTRRPLLDKECRIGPR
ncbi:hypothetical protein CR51_14100 [Caballeronia megalochromosomata]|nr:hypothetical protein CR51_14100 [Caballeronia megalochromosomata]